MYVLAYMYLIYSDHCNNQHHTQWDKSQQYDYTAVHSSNVHNFLNNPRRTCCFDKLFNEAEKKPYDIVSGMTKGYIQMLITMKKT